MELGRRTLPTAPGVADQVGVWLQVRDELVRDRPIKGGIREKLVSLSVSVFQLAAVGDALANR